jgi:hypothetical protein
MRWVANSEIRSAHSSDSGFDTSHSETMAAYSAARAPIRPVDRDEESERPSGFVAGLMDLLDQADKSLPADDEKEMSAADLAEHAEWIEEFFFELHSPEAVTAADDAQEAGFGIISGHARTLSGYPVEGAQVTATLRQYSRTPASVARGSAKAEYKTTTNAHGFFAFRDLPTGIYMVGVPNSGFYSAARIEVRTGVKFADLVLNPQRYAQIRGNVTDMRGSAIEGVQIMPLVKGIPAGVRSNTKGEFEFGVTVDRELRSFPVRFQAPGFREMRYEITESDWSAGSDALVTVVMEPIYESATVAGSIKDTAGLPAAGEIVRLYSSSLKRNYRAVADGGGEYEFAKVEPADDYQLWVRPAGPYRDFVDANVVVTAGYVRHDIELETLERGNRLSGRIMDHKGRPVPGLTLTVHSKAALGQTQPITSDGYGEFVVENVPEGELVFESRSMPYYLLTGLHVSGSDTDKEVELVLNRGRHKLLGKVIGSDGMPVAAPNIFITASKMVSGMRTHSSSSTSADADGRFVFTDLSTGQHTITVNAPGYEGVRLQPVVGSERELLIRLEKNTS